MSHCVCNKWVFSDAVSPCRIPRRVTWKLLRTPHHAPVSQRAIPRWPRTSDRLRVRNSSSSQSDASAGKKKREAPSKHSSSGAVPENDTSDIGSSARAATLEGEISSTKLLESTREAAGWKPKNSSSNSNSSPTEDSSPKRVLDDAFLLKVASAEDAQSALEMISDRAEKEFGIRVGVVSSEDCSAIIQTAISRGNSALAFSMISAMQNALFQSRERFSFAGNKTSKGSTRNASTGLLTWQWAGADVNAYGTLVRGLAMSLKVSEAISAVDNLRRRGIPQGDEEVQFGKIVNCPTCIKPLAVVQPQHGIQIIPCSSCLYKYELISGNIVSCESEVISGNMSLIERGLRVLRIIRRPSSSAVHSMLISTPDGVTRTYRFGTESSEVPAQEGDRVTIASAAPAPERKGLNFFSRSARVPGWRPGEPMALTNHITRRVMSLVRAPPKDGSAAAVETSWILPTVALLATGDAATSLVDPNLPFLLAASAASTAAIAGTANAYLLPKMNQLPQDSVGSISFRQQLLKQHELLEKRLESLTQSASQEVRMLARLSQLQNKMEAVGDISTYGARIDRVKKAKEGLDERLTARLDLIDSYAKIASMIEIEVEMDADVLAAEAAGNAESIAEQIEKLMEVEDLQAQWKIQAEANDEVERLLQNDLPL